MRIGAVAEAAQVTVETLRFYERRGMLAAPIRLSSGYRDYPAQTVDVVRFIKHAQQLGFTLDDIKGMLQLADGGPESCDSVRELAEAKIHEITVKISQLDTMQYALQQLVSTCQRPRQNRECPLLVPVPGPSAATR